MANTYKNIIITPNIGNTADPKIQFLGGNTTANTDINLFVYPSSNGTVSFEGSAGQLFSITNDLSNSLFAVSDVSGIPSLEVFANGLVSVIPFSGNVVFGNSSVNVLVNSTAVVGNTVGTHTGAVVLGTSSLSANGGVGTAGQVLHSNGTATYWAADDNAGGTVTSVASGNGITGGTITGAGTLSAVAGTGTVVNATGIHVNATYIGTLSANNTTYVNGKTEGNLNVNNATTAYGKTEGNLNVNAAAQLVTTRTINGVNFNGTANILVPSTYDANYRRINNPGGAEYIPGTASVTGALQITLPVGWTNSMMRMTIKIYDYAANKGFDVVCGGYNYVTGSSWINTFAYILADKDEDRRFTVRFGYTAGAKCVIYIGELASTWSYPQVYVTDVQVGHSGQSASWVSGWTMGVQASAFENVTATVTSTQVGYGTSTSTADALVLRDASSNFAANNITANTTGIHTGNVVATTITGNLTGNVAATNLTASGNAFFGGFAQIAGAASTVGIKFPGAGTQYGLAMQPAADSTNMITFFNAANSVVGSVTQTATTLVYNGTGASLAYANVSGQVNSATIYATTSANIASAVQANATGLWTTGTVNAASHTVGTAFTANATVVNAVSYYAGTLLVANTTVINATHLGGIVAASYVQNTDSRTLSGNLNFTGSNTTIGGEFRVVNSSANVFLATANGNIGIGNVTPTARISIKGAPTMTGGWGKSLALNATFPVLIFNSNDTKYSAIGVDYSTTNAGMYFWTNASSEDIPATGTISMAISHTGNVGIGSTSPAHKLSVVGPTNLAGAVTGITTLAAGNTTITGFVNATSSVNAASHTVATNFIANTSGVYSTGTVNAAVVSSTNATFTRVTDIYQGAGDIRNNLGNPSVEEKALFHGQMNNKFRFIAPTSQEESTDNVTWTASTRATTAQLGDLMVGEGQGTSFIAIPSGTIGTAGYYRLTWDVFGTTNYIFLNHLYIFCETQGLTTTFTVEAFNNATSTWDSIASGTASNWPGHVSIKHNTIPYNSSLSAGFYGKVRVTFAVPSRSNTNAVYLSAIEWFGGYPSAKRNVESYDRFKNVTFPANLAAVSISGNLTGNVIATTISGNLTGNVVATTITGNLTGNTAGIHTGAVVLGTSSLSANGGVGTAGQVLHSNGTATYWAADDNAGGTVTSVATGNGLTGGTITTTGTLSAVAGTGTVVNATGIHVNATYIGTLSANNTTYVNGKTEGNLNVNSAASATTASQIDGIDFYNGNSTNPVVGPDNLTNNGIAYVSSISLLGQSDGALHSQAYSTSWVHQIYGDYRTGQIALRGKNSGTWQSWRVVLDSSNFTSYAPNTSGGSATGTWGISITGTSNNATNLGGVAAANYARTDTADDFAGVVTFNANAIMTKALSANGGYGTAGQVLTSGAAGNVYWATPTVGDITAVTAGNGLTGGGTSGDVTLTVGAANGITVSATTVGATQGTGLVVNATGIHVNATYIGTISANNASYLGGTAAAGYQTTAGLSANVATLTSNNSTFMNGNTVVTVMESLRANRSLSGGGTITVDAGYNVLWSTRFIVISNGRGTHFSTTGFFDISCPTSGTITGVGGATNKTATVAGIPLVSWDALYYILPIGSNNTSVAANFRVANYTADVEIPSTWVLICIRNGDTGQIHFNNGITLTASQSYNTVSFNAAIAPLANNATNLGGVAAANYARTDAADDFAGIVTFNANVVMTKSLSANGGFGTAGQVLTSGATGNAYWSTPVATVNVDAQYAWTNVHSFSNAVNLATTAGSNVGIGTSSPSDKLQVAATSADVDFSGRVDSATAAHRPSFRFIHTGGSLTTQSPASSRLGLVSFLGVNDSSSLTTYSFFDSFLDGTANSTANSYIRFYTTALGSSAERLRIGAGNITVNADVTLPTAAEIYIGNSTVNAVYSEFGMSAEDDIGDSISVGADQIFMSSTSGTGQYTSSGVTVTGSGVGANAGYLYSGYVQVGNATAFATYSSANLSIYGGSALYANLSASSFTMSNFLVANSLGVFHSGVSGTVNAASHTIGTTFIANTVGVYHTGTVNAASHTVGTAFTANATGVYHTGTMNAASHTIGTTLVANATGVYHTGTVNAASHTVGTAFTANATVVNAVSYYAGTLLVANTTVINATHLAGIAGSGYARRGGGLGNIDYNVQRTLASGFYSVDAAPTNGPSGVGTYSNFIQMYERSDTAAQVVIDYATGYMYSRGIQTATPTYSPWRTQLNDTNIGSYAVRGTVKLTVGTTGHGSPAVGDLWVDTN